MTISGGVVPGGICLSKRLRDRGDLRVGGRDIDGWVEVNLDDAKGGIRIRLKVRSMSLTVVVNARSNGVRMRPAIWSGGKPWYCHATPMIGMSMLGKMSTGTRSAASVPRRRMSSPATTKCVGPVRSAIRTMASMRHRDRRHPGSPSHRWQTNQVCRRPGR